MSWGKLAVTGWLVGHFDEGDLTFAYIKGR